MARSGNTRVHIGAVPHSLPDPAIRRRFACYQHLPRDPLVAAHRRERIDACGAPSGDVARHERNAYQKD